MLKLVLILVFSAVFVFAASNSAADFCRTPAGNGCNTGSQAAATLSNVPEEEEEAESVQQNDKHAANSYQVCFFFLQHF